MPPCSWSARQTSPDVLENRAKRVFNASGGPLTVQQYDERLSSGGLAHKHCVLSADPTGAVQRAMNKTSVVGLANVRSGGLVPADMTVKAEFCGRTVNVPVNRVQPGNATYTFWPQGTHKPTWQDRAAQAAHKLGVLKLGK